MSGPIYHFWRCRFTEAWYELPKQEQDDLMAKIQAAFQFVGGKSTLTCSSAWASEEVQFWGVEELPDLEAVQKLAELQTQLNWYRYVDSQTLLGTKVL